MKNLVFSFGVDLHLCLGIVSFKMESSNQEVTLRRKVDRIYDSALQTVRIIDQNRNIFEKIPTTIPPPPTISSGQGMGTEKKTC